MPHFYKFPLLTSFNFIGEKNELNCDVNKSMKLKSFLQVLCKPTHQQTIGAFSSYKRWGSMARVQSAPAMYNLLTPFIQGFYCSLGWPFFTLFSQIVCPSAFLVHFWTLISNSSRKCPNFEIWRTQNLIKNSVDSKISTFCCLVQNSASARLKESC